METETHNTARAEEATEGEDGASTRRDLIEWLGDALDVWRSKIDELLVQGDLASKDARDEIRARTEEAERAYLAARVRLGDLPHDVGSSVSALRMGMDKVLADLRQAYESAEATIRRSRAN